jgi:pilus assembly protein CpaC
MRKTGMAAPLSRLLSLLAAGLIYSIVASAQTQVPAQVAQPLLLSGGATIDLAVPLYQSRVVTALVPATRVSVANPEVADIVVISPTQFYVLGKDLGTTNVLLWDRDNRLIGALNLEVQHDLDSLKRKYAELLPNQAIEVRAVQRSIVLSGRVTDAETLNAAQRIAETYLSQGQTAKQGEQSAQSSQSKSVGAVINLLQVGGTQQVMLEVKVAEIARTEVKRLDAQFNTFAQGLGHWNVGGVNGGASFPPALIGTSQLQVPVFTNPAPYGPAIAAFAPSTPSILSQGLFASFLDKNLLFNLALDAATEKGLARILAEPTLTTLSGQEAQFVSGGEFPIPVPQANNTVTITFKTFGVQVKFLPVVLNSGHINLKVNVSVSDLATTNTVSLGVAGSSSSFVIPSLSERSASGVVELSDGQTIGLAGLLHATTSADLTKFPGLGSLPILGALFSSSNYQKGETELVILVTPRLAQALPPGKPRLPTDSYVEPSDWDFFLRGRQEGTAPKRPAAPSADGSTKP